MQTRLPGYPFLIMLKHLLKDAAARFALSAALLAPGFMPGEGTAQNAYDIVKKADDCMRGTSLQAEMTIRTIRPGWTREMVLKTWSLGADYSMILITAPKKDQGIVFLKRNKEVWNWMPALERTIKLPPSMMAQSWMGTDFSNDDLVRESSVLSDYTHTLVGDTLIRQRSCHLIRLIPKPDAPVVWGMLILCIDKTDFIELHARFYDEDGMLVNTMNAFDVKKMDDRLIPTRMEMIPADKPNHKTELIYNKVLFNRPLTPPFFTLENMKNLR